MTKRGGPEALLFGTGPHAGRTLVQVASEREQPFADVLIDIGSGGGQAAHFVMDRSEEHTSELQSLMRISYAVFCLKKKKNIHNQLILVHNTQLIHNKQTYS